MAAGGAPANAPSSLTATATPPLSYALFCVEQARCARLLGGSWMGKRRRRRWTGLPCWEKQLCWAQPWATTTAPCALSHAARCGAWTLEVLQLRCACARRWAGGDCGMRVLAEREGVGGRAGRKVGRRPG